MEAVVGGQSMWDERDPHHFLESLMAVVAAVEAVVLVVLTYG